MSIASAIAALNPSIWYKLDGSDGATAPNSGTMANDGTVSGTVDWTVDGPEFGKTALRLFTGSQLVSHQMDLTTFVGQSLGLWIAMDASGAINTLYPFINIGDPANRLTRGPMLLEQHSSIGTPRLTARYGITGTALISPNEPMRFWHWIVATFASGTSGLKLYVDGALQPAINLTSPGALVATDPLLVRSDQPVVVAHVCWWGGVLTQTEVQSVGNELATWPYSQPINTPPPSGGGGGGIPPETQAQIDDIQAKVGDIPGLVDAATYISDQVNVIRGYVEAADPIIREILDDVRLIQNVVTHSDDFLTEFLQNAVTVSIETVGGLVQKTIGELLSGKTTEFLTLEDISGGGTCLPIEHGIVRAYYGITIRMQNWPSTWEPVAPDADFWIPDFCVLRIFRGDSIIYRKGIHSVAFTEYPFPTLWPGLINETAVLPPPEDTRIRVDWAAGCCGQVLLWRFP